jgi:hypothetical protein
MTTQMRDRYDPESARLFKVNNAEWKAFGFRTARSAGARLAKLRPVLNLVERRFNQ